MKKNWEDEFWEKFDKRYTELMNKTNHSAADKAEYEFIMEAHLNALMTNDPEEFKRRYGQYEVSQEEFERVTGISAQDLLKKQS